MRDAVSLQDVFGIADRVNEHSYIDRGGLDAQLRYALDAGRHVAIHGASKQGKSWLRARLLDEGSSVLVQCQSGSTTESIFTDALGELGVRAEIRHTSGSDFEGTLDFRGSGSIGLHFLGKVGLDAKAGGRRGRSRSIESQPIGQAPANLQWVARTILASQKRLVIEDCHYLHHDCLQDLAFIMKALGGYGLHILVAGIWPQDHLLTFYNGDLVGRVEDIHLTWDDAELDAVLQAGSRVLNIEISSNLRRTLVTDAAGNVGLLQQLAEAICREERMFSRQSSPQYLTAGPSLTRARSVVAGNMRQRFQAFAENFDSTTRHMLPATREPLLLLRAILSCSDEELLQGIDDGLLASRACDIGHRSLDSATAQNFLSGLGDVHAAMGMRPPVISYNEYLRKLYLTDQSLLFFRRYGSPKWPWQ
jgi:hypothetical protein